jgi:hypothetical protein
MGKNYFLLIQIFIQKAKKEITNHLMQLSQLSKNQTFKSNLF